MPFTKFTNLDFDQIKTSIKDYLRANSTFTDFDFEGSNFSILIDTLAYNTYITAFNSNMIVNESFLDSATLRENVVSLARNIGYVPRSRTAANAKISFTVERPSGDTSSQVTLQRGLVCTGTLSNSSYVFSIPEDITKTFNTSGFAYFDNIDVYEGTFLTKQFVYDGSLDQKFILNNPFIDTSTLKVYIKAENDSGLGIEYSAVDNIINVTSLSQIYLLQEVQDEKYQLFFGDGLIGKKLGTGSNADGNIITANYIVTNGSDGNGASRFAFSGSLQTTQGNFVNPTDIGVTTNQNSQNGAEIESIDSVKYFAPRIYSAQNRAVTSRDYEAIIKTIYPDTESVAVVGGEELDPPEFGTVSITIKPKNGDYVSDYDKQKILSDLKSYSLTGINQKILDLKVLYVEIDSHIYYNSSQVTNVNDLRTDVVQSLTKYADSGDINKFGGRFKYSKVLNVIDNIDEAITSNITKVRIRRNLRAITNTFAQYELCYGNKFHINPDGKNLKSTGFTVPGETSLVYLSDVPNKDINGKLDGSGKGKIAIIKKDLINGENVVVVSSAGTVDYVKGEVILTTINITSTEKPNDIIEIQAFPDSNDIIGLTDLYLNLNIPSSSINMVKDTISSGEQISGIGFKVTSSYTNGELIRE